MRTGVILASHGEFARAALGSAEMVAGPQPDICALALQADTSLEDFEAAFRDAYDQLSSQCDLVVCLCDILGGTPFNVVARVKAAGLELLAYTGLSMPVLLELLITRGQYSTEWELANVIEAAGASALQRIDMAPVPTEDGEDL
ncbi:hypothetical protein QJ043_05375 [Olsenella sp. YH-ols2217]|uniref:PTS EIIA type-4 domain-containing protein n=1 Tax=Kribbibacterium absianum TaxID=3044210 RepID=A0ABT6ZKF3_9ACTN|nr:MULTISPECIES: hypothetical protein [unclassified Olsenella]MDJ1122530.1 hypothetical protein [Olsenella sp. YH-ols2216]MDJ1129510.1 hypothetical protein [Olsenella sp. YH-ols2217]